MNFITSGMAYGSSSPVVVDGVFCPVVWLGIMLPVLGMKALSAYAIAYLERLLT